MEPVPTRGIKNWESVKLQILDVGVNTPGYPG